MHMMIGSLAPSSMFVPETKRGLVVSKRLIEAHIWLIVNLIGLVKAVIKYSYTYNSVVGLHNTVTCI